MASFLMEESWTCNRYPGSRSRKLPPVVLAEEELQGAEKPEEAKCHHTRVDEEERSGEAVEHLLRAKRIQYFGGKQKEAGKKPITGRRIIADAEKGHSGGDDPQHKELPSCFIFHGQVFIPKVN
jgi:hypothetical protein